MRRPLPLRAISSAAAATIAIAFIASDIVAVSDWEWRAALDTIWHKPEPSRNNSEVRNYVEFVQTRHLGLTITTGIEYASSYDRRVSRQWCYAERADGRTGDPEYKLSLATKAASRSSDVNTFTDANLSPLGLTEAGARTLAIEFCRFR